MGPGSVVSCLNGWDCGCTPVAHENNKAIMSLSRLLRNPRLTYTATLTIFVAYLLGIQSGDSIKCWVCRSDGDPKCADPFDNTSFPIADCAREKPREHLPGLQSTMCRKVRQKVNGNWRYIRSCAWLGEPGVGRDERYCIHRSGTYNIHVEYCTCRSKDGCNGSKATSPSHWIIFWTLLIAAFSAKKLSIS